MKTVRVSPYIAGYNAGVADAGNSYATGYADGEAAGTAAGYAAGYADGLAAGGSSDLDGFALDFDAESLPLTITAAMHGQGAADLAVSTPASIGIALAADGAVTLTGSVAGTVQISAATITAATGGPAAPTITDLTTSSTQPTIAGTYDASDFVELYVNVDGTEYTTGDAGLTASGGAWSLDLSTAGQTITAAVYTPTVTAVGASHAVTRAGTVNVLSAVPLRRYAFRHDSSTVRVSLDVSGGNGSLTLPTAYTVITWIRPLDLGGSATRYAFAADSGPGGSVAGVLLAIGKNTNDYRVLVRTASGTNTWIPLTFAASVNPYDDVLRKLWVSVDGDSVTLGIDSDTTTTTITGVQSGAVTTAGNANPVQLGARWSSDDLKGTKAVAILSRALTAGEVAAIDTIESLQADPDLILAPSTDAQWGADPTDATWSGPAGDWIPTTSGGWLTEDAADKSCVVVAMGQSQVRTSGVTIDPATADLPASNVLALHPDQGGLSSDRQANWNSRVNSGQQDGPEAGCLHETGTVPRHMIKTPVKGGTPIQEFLDTHWYTLVDDFEVKFGLGWSRSVLYFQQGESDTSLGGYAGKLDTLLTRFLTEKGGANVWMAGIPKDSSGAQGINDDQAAAAAADARVEWYDTFGLTLQGDNTHLARASVETVGGAFRDQMLAWAHWDSA